jgi:hypothetical protein
MPKFRLLLLDANVIIAAHELGIWSKLVEGCSITITRTVVEQETYYWRDEQGIPHEIYLEGYIQEGKINCVDVPLAEVKSFLQKFDPTYKMDLGEAESLAFLYYSSEKWLIASADGIVFKVLGRLGRPDQGISLEEITQKIGLTCNFDKKHGHYTKDFRLRLTKQGQQDGITGMGLKQ